MTGSTHSHGMAPSCVMTIFGVTGDLAKRLLFPSLYNLASTASLSDDFRLVGVGRRNWDDRKLRLHLSDSLDEFLGDKPSGRIVRWLAGRTRYQKVSFDDEAAYVALDDKIRKVAAPRERAANRLYYMAVGPELIPAIVRNLGKTGQVAERGGAWARIIVEKPFGHDVASALSLNRQLQETLRENQIYRIDHFAGKDAVQDLAVFRFSNAIIEPLWHRSLVDSVQITASETVGVEGRAEFYEKSGALRDMVPNHLAELLSLFAMEPPLSFSVDHMRNRQVELLESVRRIKPRDVADCAVRAQYASGAVAGRRRPAYRQEDGVSRRSMTETYVAMKVEIDNWRWSGVPFFLRTGKNMSKGVTEIAVQFRAAPARLFPNIALCTAPPNQLVFEMKPRQGIHLSVCTRAPGLETKVIGGNMALEFPAGPFGSHAKGYERPLRDAMLGDPLLFPNAAFVEQGWRLVQPLLDSWAGRQAPPLAKYSAGTDGPKESKALLAQSGHAWRPL